MTSVDGKSSAHEKPSPEVNWVVTYSDLPHEPRIRNFSITVKHTKGDGYYCATTHYSLLDKHDTSLKLSYIYFNQGRNGVLHAGILDEHVGNPTAFFRPDLVAQEDLIAQEGKSVELFNQPEGLLTHFGLTTKQGGAKLIIPKFLYPVPFQPPSERIDEEDYWDFMPIPKIFPEALN